MRPMKTTSLLRDADRTVQGSLFDSPPRPAEPRDPKVAPEARPRLSRQSRSILLTLRAGPMTGSSLALITHRFGARIWDLRKAGCSIDCDHDPASGRAIYTLRHEPEGLG